MPTILRFPKVQITLLLFLMYITAIIKYPTLENLYLFISCIGFCISFDLFFCFIRKRVLFIPYAAIVTGLILTLIIDPNANLFQIAITCTLAMAIKNFLRISGRHIFNPVASGLFIAGILFNQYTSWWGVSFQNISQFNLQNLFFFLILLSVGYVSFVRLKKYYMILTFLTTTALITLFLNASFSFQAFIATFTNPSYLFFSLVMLPEPMTSPVNYKKQIAYGILVALLPFVLSQQVFFGFLTNNFAFDSFLFSLLLGNLVFFKYR